MTDDLADDPRPFDEQRHSETAFPVVILLTTKRGGSSIGPREHFGPIVSGIHNDGVFRNAQLIELVQQLTDHLVMLRHAIRIYTKAGDALAFFLEVRKHMHPG